MVPWNRLRADHSQGTVNSQVECCNLDQVLGYMMRENQRTQKKFTLESREKLNKIQSHVMTSQGINPETLELREEYMNIATPPLISPDSLGSDAPPLHVHTFEFPWIIHFTQN